MGDENNITGDTLFVDESAGVALNGDTLFVAPGDNEVIGDVGLGPLDILGEMDALQDGREAIEALLGDVPERAALLQSNLLVRLRQHLRIAIKADVLQVLPDRRSEDMIVFSLPNIEDPMKQMEALRDILSSFKDVMAHSTHPVAYYASLDRTSPKPTVKMDKNSIGRIAAAVEAVPDLLDEAVSKAARHAEQRGKITRA